MLKFLFQINVEIIIIIDLVFQCWDNSFDYLT